MTRYRGNRQDRSFEQGLSPSVRKVVEGIIQCCQLDSILHEFLAVLDKRSIKIQPAHSGRQFIDRDLFKNPHTGNYISRDDPLERQEELLVQIIDIYRVKFRNLPEEAFKGFEEVFKLMIHKPLRIRPCPYIEDQVELRYIGKSKCPKLERMGFVNLLVLVPASVQATESLHKLGFSFDTYFECIKGRVYLILGPGRAINHDCQANTGPGAPVHTMSNSAEANTEHEEGLYIFLSTISRIKGRKLGLDGRLTVRYYPEYSERHHCLCPNGNHQRESLRDKPVRRCRAPRRSKQEFQTTDSSPSPTPIVPISTELTVLANSESSLIPIYDQALAQISDIDDLVAAEANFATPATSPSIAEKESTPLLITPGRKSFQISPVGLSSRAMVQFTSGTSKIDAPPDPGHEHEHEETSLNPALDEVRISVETQALQPEQNLIHRDAQTLKAQIAKAKYLSSTAKTTAEYKRSLAIAAADNQCLITIIEADHAEKRAIDEAQFEFEIEMARLGEEDIQRQSQDGDQHLENDIDMTVDLPSRDAGRLEAPSILELE